MCFMWKRVVVFGIGIYVVAGSRYGSVYYQGRTKGRASRAATRGAQP